MYSVMIDVNNVGLGYKVRSVEILWPTGLPPARPEVGSPRLSASEVSTGVSFFAVLVCVQSAMHYMLGSGC